ncbi:unnamed protein product [Ambrosiozyma monospora]|uniref:Unnamed protein product n=1 Tax=Ambrosiozyma monospora TaxID=43982 RepID=A0ACB5TW47_AMBMO|nr:unnamed protein product [Ambrosiozyma monospora]
MATQKKTEKISLRQLPGPDSRAFQVFFKFQRIRDAFMMIWGKHWKTQDSWPLKHDFSYCNAMSQLKVKQKQQSAFTYRDFLDLNDVNKAYKSRLAVICHIDVNAFFAQHEQIRLGLTPKDPVVCLQWNSLIAVSYAARDYGIGRMDTLQSAKLKCPKLIVAHTAVFKKGESTWSYLDYLPSPVDHKVSLDPYRRASRKIMRIFKSNCDHVEKASVDESFMDFGRLVFRKLLELFPNFLEGLESVDDRLPTLTQEMVDSVALQWKGLVIPKPGEASDEDGERNIDDWDDLLSLIGSNFASDIRQQIVDQLGYTTSAGIGRVKTLAKLASGFKKPNRQTIVRNDAVGPFLKNFKLTDFWSMGGKNGEAIMAKLDVPYSSQGDEIAG